MLTVLLKTSHPLETRWHKAGDMLTTLSRPAFLFLCCNPVKSKWENRRLCNNWVGSATLAKHGKKMLLTIVKFSLICFLCWGSDTHDGPALKQHRPMPGRWAIVCIDESGPEWLPRGKYSPGRHLYHGDFISEMWDGLSGVQYLQITPQFPSLMSCKCVP